MVQEIAGDEIDEIDSPSIKSGLTSSESRETSKALNNVGDNEHVVVQRNIGDKDGETVVASSIKTNGMCTNENVISPNVNLPIREHRRDEASGVASSCIKTKDVSNVIVSIRKENNPLKRKYTSELCDNNDSDNGDSDNGVDKQSLSKKKFNIYTGCSCDFARKVVEDMVKNGEFRDK
ncbi:hypothetical protein OS493_005868 [Desmophyllum pertusum]|uniref:Uncharacterized protein n=1 Tax=Desmophyllum pertusum TaxID=174260 RepID=A0A9W9YFI8_9CNID|nr:hypothetical protein OS493_005868 [Desmophyllum pertusum]